jgi:hypothetical protein
MCTSPRKQHQCHHRQLTLIVPLLCAFLQEDNISATITNLRSLRLCYLHLSKKTLSTPPSSTLFKSPKAIDYFLPWTKNFLTYCLCMLLDSSLQLKMKVIFVLCAYLLAFFPRCLLRFGLHSVWWKKCWIKYSTWILNYFNICNKKVCKQILTLVAMLNVRASIGAFEEGSVFLSRLLKALQMSLWGVTWLTNVQNVGTWRMHATCSTRCPWRMWSPGIPYL